MHFSQFCSRRDASVSAAATRYVFLLSWRRKLPYFHRQQNTVNDKCYLIFIYHFAELFYAMNGFALRQYSVTLEFLPS
jgi:hypothetical protein